MFVRQQRTVVPMIFLLCSSISIRAYGQTKSTEVDMGQTVNITYGSPSWNGDSRKVDSARLVIRDKNTGRIVQIQLEETAPDSGVFNGQFNVSWANVARIAPEVFIPPKELRATEKDSKKMFDMIQSGKMARKPFVFKKNEKGQPVLDTYDTREQAAEAFKAYQEEARLAAEAKRKKLLKPIPSEAALEAQEQMNESAEMRKLALEAAQREGERARLEQIEKQRLQRGLDEFKTLSAREQKQQKERAKALANQAAKQFASSQFAEAEKTFLEASNLDPETGVYYYRYSTTLYRTEKFNDAMVALRLAKVEASLETERKYYIGLIHYRLKEYAGAIKTLGEVGAAQDPVMSPSSIFYRGLIYFAQERFDEAKKDFETVIDTSSDPRIDEQAEQYLDNISAAIANKKLRERKWTLTGMAGVMYDSNVLVSPDNQVDQGFATDAGDWRAVTVADVEYRPIYTDHHELGAKATANLTNSAKNDSAPGDAFVYTFAAPYSYKSVLLTKGYKGTAKPGYEMLYMDPNGTGTKTDILNSMFVNFDNTFVMARNWFSTYSFEYRLDDSLDASSVGPNDSDSTKYSLKMAQTMLLDKAGKTAMVASAGLIYNDAVGANKEYMRYEGGIIYVRPIKWEASWSAGVSFYKVRYKKADPSRNDFNTTYSTGVTKPIREWFTWGLTGSYIKNDSDIDTNEYTKYMVMTTATFTTSF